MVRLLNVFALAYFEVVEPAFGLKRLLLDVLPRVILDDLHLMRHILSQIQHDVRVVSVQYVLPRSDLSDPDYAVVPVEEISREAICRVFLAPIMNALVQEVKHEDLVRIVGENELVLV